MSLPEALERAAAALPEYEDALRDANGDPARLLATLPAPGAAAVLQWLLEREPSEGGELALAFADLDGGAGPLAAIDEAALAKPGRKALRRALHRLRSRGVALPEAPRAAAPVVARLPSIEDDLEAARLSAIDPRGTRVAHLVVAHPAGGARLFEIVLDDLRGIVDARVYSAGRSKVRHFLRELGERRRAASVEVEPAALRALVARIAARQTPERPLPRSFVEFRSQLGLDVAAATPGEQVGAALGPVEPDAERLEAVRARVAAGELGPWPPDPQRLHALALRLKALREGDGPDADATREARDDEARKQAADELFDAAFTAATIERLRESAFMAWKAGDDETARSLLAAAAAFETRAPSAQPVAEAFVERLLAPLLEALEAPAPAEGPAAARPAPGGG